MLGANCSRRIPPRRLGLPDHFLHHVVDVVDVEARAVEGAVRGDRAQHLADRPESALFGGLRALQHHRRRTHPHDHAVPPAVERNGGFFHDIVGRRRAAGQEPGAEPLDQVVGRDVVRRDDDHPAAAPGADPVLRQSDRLGGARARRIDLRVRAPCADQLGELRVPHGEHPEQETAVEVERHLRDGSPAVRR